MSETAIQCKTVREIRKLLPTELKRNFFAIPNGANVSKGERSKLVAEGLQTGVPDLFFACPNADYCGLFIEMKDGKKGQLSKEQKIQIPLLEAVGFKVVICLSADEAIKEFSEYMRGV